MDPFYSYRVQDAEKTIRNPYLDDVASFIINHAGAADTAAMLECRELLISKYAFSVPTIAALRAIARYSPIVEIGAGSGYWAYCLSQLGVDIAAFDARPPDETLPWPWGGIDGENAWFEVEHFPVIEGDERMASLHPDRALMLCWPPFNRPMAGRAVEYYSRAGGTRLIYIGDPLSSGDALFHEWLKKAKLVERHDLLRWPGNDDRLEIYDLSSPA